jgi:hypothetical protein
VRLKEVGDEVGPECQDKASTITNVAYSSQGTYDIKYFYFILFCDSNTCVQRDISKVVSYLELALHESRAWKVMNSFYLQFSLKTLYP